MNRLKPATREKYRAIVEALERHGNYRDTAAAMSTSIKTVFTAVKAHKAGALDEKEAPQPEPVASEPSPDSPPAPEQLPLPSPDELDLYAEVAQNYFALLGAVTRAEEKADETLVARLRAYLPPMFKLLKDLRPDPEDKGTRVSPVEMAQYGDAAEAKLRTYAQRSREAMLDLLLQWLGEHPAEEPAVVDCLVHIGILPRGWSAQPEAM